MLKTASSSMASHIHWTQGYDMPHFLTEYWLQIVFLGGMLVATGKFIQVIDGILKRLAEMDERIQSIEDRAKDSCPIAECRKFRELCENRNAAQFNDIKTILRLMDDRREKTREDMVSIMSDVSCRLGRIEGHINK